jgi:hypothetical protein
MCKAKLPRTNRRDILSIINAMKKDLKMKEIKATYFENYRILYGINSTLHKLLPFYKLNLFNYNLH